MTVTEFLKTRVPFLCGLTDEQARTLATAAAQELFRKDQTVVFKGVTVDGLYVVATGQVSVWVRPEKSKALTAVARLGPGEVFGETSILEMCTASATVRSDEDDTLLFVIPQEAFRAVMEQNPDFRARALALMAARKQAVPPKPV